MIRNAVRSASRRQFLRTAAIGAAAAWMRPLALVGDEGQRRPKVAAVFTEFRFRSHAYNILENFFEPYLFRGKLVDPGVEVVSFYADQFPENDMAREVSRTRKVPLFDTIAGALCLGGKQLAVDAVLLIGEHGEYPLNDLGQRMYPRKQFFDQIVAVMRDSRRYVPIFNDKHLSYGWEWAKEMYDAACAHGIPLLAGSSVPLAQRVPPLDLPAGAEIEEAVAIHGGGLESYDFHGLELLQSFVEFRCGGETGVARVELLTGDALAQAQAHGRWSQALAESALHAERALHAVRQERPTAGIAAWPRQPPEPTAAHALMVTYTDGLKGTVLKIGSDGNRWNFACRLKGEQEPRATALFNSPWGNRGLFKALSHAIQHLFVTGQAPYPVERTLLVSGVLDAAMHSHAAGGKAIETPHLEFRYQPRDFAAFRENGDSWKIITDKSAQPVEFSPGDARFLR